MLEGKGLGNGGGGGGWRGAQQGSCGAELTSSPLWMQFLDPVGGVNGTDRVFHDIQVHKTRTWAWGGGSGM